MVHPLHLLAYFGLGSTELLVILLLALIIFLGGESGGSTSPRPRLSKGADKPRLPSWRLAYLLPCLLS